jgi:hypothetical protein
VVSAEQEAINLQSCENVTALHCQQKTKHSNYMLNRICLSLCKEVIEPIIDLMDGVPIKVNKRFFIKKAKEENFD